MKTKEMNPRVHYPLYTRFKWSLWQEPIVYLLPWRMKVALWNYCFNAQVDWRTKKAKAI